MEEYNPNKKRKALNVFDGMIPDMPSNKKRNSVVTELFIRVRKLNIFLVYITQSYFKAPKDVRPNTTIKKIPSKKELRKLHLIIHQILNLCIFMSLKDVMNLYKKCTAKPYHFLLIDAVLASNNLLSFRENLLEKI